MHIKNLILTYRWVVNNFIIFTIKNFDKSMFLIWYKYKYCKIGTAEYVLYFTCVPWKVGVLYQQKNKVIRLCFHLVGLSGLGPPTPTLSGKVFLKCGWNTYCLLTFIYENFSTTKFLLQQNKSNLLLQFVANVLIFDILFVLKRSKTI